MVKKKVVKKTAKRKAAPKNKAAPKRKAAPKKKAAPKRKATKRKAAPKKTNKNTGLSSGLDDTFQNWVNQQVSLMNKKKR